MQKYAAEGSNIQPLQHMKAGVEEKNANYGK